ncbi:MBL fold metallo-hydrolase [Hellea balneolensis]|uniref:MBL fold metallo-hydrolase n=1 Tax=Hellea balneolensis TaxID=287478 RepID=UPI0003F8F1A8|nr:MBL fold metallo-hydrolase [Hellea balneolensis]
MLKHLLFTAAVIGLAACGAETTAEPQASKTDIKEAATPKQDIKTQDLGDGFYMLLGPGGNIGVSVGEDGVFVIDDKFSRFADQIIGQIRGITDAPIRYVINTHYHGDHSGANADMKETGAVVVAHDNVRKRMGMSFENKAFGRTVDAVDETLWPDLTYSENATFHFNGQTVQAIHTPNAHTDGDSILFFKEANILHMGDNFFFGLFPYIDVDGGGSLAGMIASHEKALELVNDESKIIPGHGPLADKGDLEKTYEMLKTIEKRVIDEIKRGASLDDILKKDILADYAEYSSFIDKDNMVKIAHRSILEMQ